MKQTTFNANVSPINFTGAAEWHRTLKEKGAVKEELKFRIDAANSRKVFVP